MAAKDLLSLARAYQQLQGIAGVDRGRLTLDCCVHTDIGMALPFAVVEFKSLDAAAPIPPALARISPRPVKLSKFLWATEV
jgi:hypothetical protein